MPVSYTHLDVYKRQDLIGVPWLVALALRGDGWYLRSSIIWHKGNAMPESTRDRPTRCYEYVFLLTKSKKYYYDWQAVAEPIAPTTAVRLKSGVGTVSYTHLDVYKRQVERKGAVRPCI